MLQEILEEIFANTKRLLQNMDFTLKMELLPPKLNKLFSKIIFRASYAFLEKCFYFNLTLRENFLFFSKNSLSKDGQKPPTYPGKEK